VGTAGTAPLGIDLEIDGVITTPTNTNWFRKTGPGLLALTAANTCILPDLLGGTLALGNNAALGTNAGGVVAVFSPTDPSLNPTYPGVSNVIMAINQPYSSAATWSFYGTTPSTLTVAGTFNMTLSGAISELTPGTTTGTIVKNGTLTLTLSGANSYNGPTTINAGIVNIQNATALGTAVGGTTVAAGAELDIQGGIAVGAEALTLNSTGTTGAGALLNVVGANTFGGAVTFNTSSTIGSTAGTLTLSNANAVAIGNNQTATFAGAGNTTVSGIVSGAGTSNVVKNGAGTLILSGTNTYNGATTINTGTLQIGNAGASGTLGAGAVTDNAALVFNRTDPAPAVSNVISGTGTLTQAGTGTLTLSAIETYTGATTVSAGTLLVDGSTAAGSAVKVNAGILGGSGTVNGSVTGGGGAISPGDPEANPGKLNTGAVSATAASTLKVQLNGTNQGVNYDWLNVAGTVNLNNIALNATCGYAAANNDALTIVTSTGLISNTFSNAAANAIIPISGQNFQVIYNANSVILKRIITTYTWSGLGADNNWATGANWVGGVAPDSGDSIIFPSGAARQTNTDNIAAGTVFNSIQFTGAGYNISGNQFGLGGGAAALVNNVAGLNIIGDNIAFSAAPTISCLAGGTLTVGGTLDNGGFLLTVASAGTTNLNGVISNTGALSQTGAGTLTLAAANLYTGTTTSTGGTLIVTGSLAGGAGLTTATSTVLAGTGTVQALTVNASSSVEPGINASSTGILTAAGNTIFSGGGTLATAAVFAPLLNGDDSAPGANYCQLAVGGSLNISNTTLSISTAGNFPSGFNTPVVGNKYYDNTFVIVNKTSVGAITGTFQDTSGNPLPEGAFVMNNNKTQGFIISYVGGNGRSVTLHQIPILVSSMYNDGGPGSSFPGVDPGDTVTLTFSVPVSAVGGAGVVPAGEGANIGDIGLAVAGDTFSASTIDIQGPSNTITIVLHDDGVAKTSPLLTPAGSYLSSAITAGSPSGVYIASGTFLADPAGNHAHAYGTLAAGQAAAVDLGPGGAGFITVQWSDNTIAPKTWDLTIGGTVQLDIGQTSVASATAPPNGPGAPGYLLQNIGTTYCRYFISCSASSAPSGVPPGTPGWTPASAAGTDQFALLAGTAVGGPFPIVVSAAPQVLDAGVYSGQYRVFDLQLTTPLQLTNSAGVAQNITVTITITSP
jgi:autotransporter-associated beta strand protein